MSDSQTGRTFSPETRAKLSAANMGHVTSPETRTKLSVTQVGFPSASLWKGGPRVYRAKSKAKRRALGFNTLNSWFLGCEGHHVNKDDVIYMLKAAHRSIKHNIWTGKNMDKINVLAGQYLTEVLA